MTGTSQANRPAPTERETPIARVALRFTAFSEKWLPDAFGFVLVGTVLVLALGLITGESLVGSPKDPATATSGFGLIDAWGKGFWDLIDFTLQMAMIVIGGYVVATSPPVARLIVWLARVPSTPRAAIAYVAAVAMVASYLNWAFSLVFAAILAREIARNVPRVDYRALGAMAFIGLGTVWAQGLSGSAALQVASTVSSPPPVQEVVKANGYSSGTIPLSDTIFLWQSLVATLVVFVVAVGMAWLLAPTGEKARTAEDMGVTLRPLVGPGAPRAGDESGRPGDWLERSPLFGLIIAAIALVYVVRHFADQDNPITALDLNTINMILLIGALVLHWQPRRLVAAVREGAGAASGVLLQFPFYGGIFGMIVYTGLSQRIAGWLVNASSQFLFPPLIAVYSCILGIFVPSGGSKWVIEAPYVLDAANQLDVHAGWMVVVYDLGEASANLLQPFWMLPTLAVLGLKARDIMGYTFAMFLVLFPVVLVLVTLLAPHVTG
jgi:short-chain fatty acids transporter